MPAPPDSDLSGRHLTLSLIALMSPDDLNCAMVKLVLTGSEHRYCPHARYISYQYSARAPPARPVTTPTAV